MRTKTPMLAEKMLDVAGRLFGTRRFHEVRMEDIAIEAAVSKGTLYRYFRDKEELFLALLARASQQLVAELKSRVDQAEGGRNRLIAFVDAILGFFDRQPHVFDLIQRAEVRHEQGAAFPWQTARDESMRIIAEIIDQARRSGEFTLRHSATDQLLLLGGLRAIIRYGERPRPDGLAVILVDDFLSGAAIPGDTKPRKPPSPARVNGTRKPALHPS